MTDIDIGEYHLSHSTKRMMDLVCCGMESGGYGSFIIEQFVTPREMSVKMDDFCSELSEKRVYKHVDYPFNEGGAVVLQDKYGDEPDKFYNLNRESLAKGMQILFEKYPHLYGQWMSENEDAITGDAFIQCCVLGDIVYG